MYSIKLLPASVTGHGK